MQPIEDFEKFYKKIYKTICKMLKRKVFCISKGPKVSIAILLIAYLYVLFK